MANFCFYWRPGRYTWHTPTLTRGGLDRPDQKATLFEERLRFSLGLEVALFRKYEYAL